jgi:hypothetical protein
MGAEELQELTGRLSEIPDRADASRELVAVTV